MYKRWQEPVVSESALNKVGGLSSSSAHIVSRKNCGHKVSGIFENSRAKATQRQMGITKLLPVRQHRWSRAALDNAYAATCSTCTLKSGPVRKRIRFDFREVSVGLISIDPFSILKMCKKRWGQIQERDFSQR